MIFHIYVCFSSFLQVLQNSFNTNNGKYLERISFQMRTDKLCKQWEKITEKNSGGNNLKIKKKKCKKRPKEIMGYFLALMEMCKCS